MVRLYFLVLLPLFLEVQWYEHWSVILTSYTENSENLSVVNFWCKQNNLNKINSNRNQKQTITETSAKIEKLKNEQL